MINRIGDGSEPTHRKKGTMNMSTKTIVWSFDHQGCGVLTHGRIHNHHRFNGKIFTIKDMGATTIGIPPFMKNHQMTTITRTLGPLHGCFEQMWAKSFGKLVEQ